jgi:alcohol dehydrogenase class IV
MLARLLNKLDSHHQIFVKELSRVLLVCANAADHSREMYDQVRSRFEEQTINIGSFDEVIFAPLRHKNFQAAKPAQTFDNEGSQEPSASCYQHLFERKGFV